MCVSFTNQNLTRDPNTLSQLRNKIWLIHGMQECRSIITKCVTCQKAFKTPLEQKMGILPEMRVTANPPFKEVRLNLMGPFGVKFPGSRATKKNWGVVFRHLMFLGSKTRYNSFCIG